MTRAEKLAAAAAYWNPVIEEKRLLKEIAEVDFVDKKNKHEDKITKYQEKINEINAYYDAQEKIMELQQLEEPEIE